MDLAKHHAKMLVRTAVGLPTWKQPKLDVNRRTTLIIDECGMCDSDKLSRAIGHAEKAGCRVVLVGDHRQLPAIGQGGLFRELWEQARDDQKTELTDIVRQREEWARKAIRQVGQGEAQAALATYKEWGQLHVLPTGDLAERELVEGWMRAGRANPRDNLILAATNADVVRLNGKAQACRWEAGQLGYRSVEVGEERIHEGDRILFTDTKKCLGLVKSEFATVTRIERLSQRLTVQIDGQDELVRFSLREFASLRLGYAATVHRAQGMTLEQDAYVLVGGSMQSREMTYVQISRGGGRRICSATSKRRGEMRASLPGWSAAPRRSSRPMQWNRMTCGATESGGRNRTPDFIFPSGRPRGDTAGGFRAGHEPEESRYPAARRDPGGGADESEHGCVSGK